MESYNQNQRTSLATRKSHRQDRQLQKADVRTTTSVETPENHHCQKAIATTTRHGAVATADGCGPLRSRDWPHNPPLSPLAQQILRHQSNCSLLPLQATFHVDNSFGIGAHVALWSQAMCNAWEIPARLKTYNPTWLWLDQVHCDLEIAREKSKWLCYFSGAEFLCGNDENDIGSDGNQIQQQLNVSDPRDKKHQCSLKKQPGFLEPFAPTLRNKLVIQEAQCQME